jgi:hypothetical protein
MPTPGMRKPDLSSHSDGSLFIPLLAFVVCITPLVWLAVHG